MKIIVQKFGGTSVQNEKSRLMAFNHIKQVLKEGYKVVVVVSAIGRYGDPYATDTLLELIGAKNTKLTAREQDTLLSVGETISASVFTNMLKEANIKAEAFSGGQAGIITSDDHLNAKITEVDTARLKDALTNLDVAVVAGFQGITANGDISTLGRGGSDTSAAALGVSLQADYIDIFTDVDGMMTADPRIVEHARSLPRVSYNEVSNMAYQGAKVIHPRAVEIAMTAKIPMRIRSTYLESTGTLVTSLTNDSDHFDVKERIVTGVAHVTNLTQISVQTDTVKAQQLAFKILADAGISLDFINISTNSVIFTVPEEKSHVVKQLLEDAGLQTTVRQACAKVLLLAPESQAFPVLLQKSLAHYLKKISLFYNQRIVILLFGY